MKALVRKTHRRRLPEQMALHFVLGEFVFCEGGTKCRDAGVVILAILAQRGVAFSLRRHRISADLHFIADQLLVYQPLRGRLALTRRSGRAVRRLKNAVKPRFQDYLGLRNHLVPHHHRNAVDYVLGRGGES